MASSLNEPCVSSLRRAELLKMYICFYFPLFLSFPSPAVEQQEQKCRGTAQPSCSAGEASLLSGPGALQDTHTSQGVHPSAPSAARARKARSRSESGCVCTGNFSGNHSGTS